MRQEYTSAPKMVKFQWPTRLFATTMLADMLVALFRASRLGDVSITNSVFEIIRPYAPYGHGGATEIREARNVTI